MSSLEPADGATVAHGADVAVEPRYAMGSPCSLRVAWLQTQPCLALMGAVCLLGCRGAGGASSAVLSWSGGHTVTVCLDARTWMGLAASGTWGRTSQRAVGGGRVGGGGRVLPELRSGERGEELGRLAEGAAVGGGELPPDFVCQLYDSCGTSAPHPHLGTTRPFGRFDRGKHPSYI